MYLSIKQIAASLPHLETLHPFFGMSFLAFKEAHIPIGEASPLNFTQVVTDVLERHYRPTSAYQGYYNPFRTARKANRWVSPRYGSTSLQRITTDTFGDVFIHTKKVSAWGWRTDYVKRLCSAMNGDKIPAFHLAVWLFRDHKFAETVTSKDLVHKLFSTYSITNSERELFDSTPFDCVREWMSKVQIHEAELLDLIGRPPSFSPEEGAALRVLNLDSIGPAAPFRYEPADRINIVTGDNSLGKTFLLDTIWWALTGNWLGCPAIPRADLPKRKAKISFELATEGDRRKCFSVPYMWERQAWQSRSRRDILPGLVIFARYDGSFAVWDPARFQSLDRDDEQSGRVFLARDAVWEGLRDPVTERWICNGLIRDWVTWQVGGERYSEIYRAFSSCLSGLSPSKKEPLVAGEPTRIPNDSRDIPTLRLAYDDVPILAASAGVQRIVTLAYLLVWAWHEHLAITRLSRKEPQRRLVLILDEVEAHLHPKWQRVIVPSLIETVNELSASLRPQLHLATHSPMVMASVESVFDSRYDSLYHLRATGKHVTLEDIPFFKRGTADRWLISEVFGLDQARSVLAEDAISQAKALQLEETPSQKAVEDNHKLLLRALADDDDFWPRWLAFAEKHGINTRQ